MSWFEIGIHVGIFALSANVEANEWRLCVLLSRHSQGTNRATDENGCSDILNNVDKN